MIPFRPVIEPAHPGAFLPEDPVFLTKHGHLLDIPWMTGLTSQEGALVVPGTNFNLLHSTDTYTVKSQPRQIIYNDITIYNI